MKINFPINNDRDYFVVAKIIAPDLFELKYTPCPEESEELYNSLTEQEKNEIKDYVYKNKRG